MAGSPSRRQLALQPAADDLKAEINALSELDDEALRGRWRRLVGRPLPKLLGRSLTLRVLAYYHQVQKFGDLDRASLQALAEIVSAPRERPDLPDPAESGPIKASGRADASIGARVIVRPGTLLVREHEGVQHRVMVLDAGFAWNGKTYDSLSKVAFAITGTHWNGPRFFGLRDRPKAQKQGRAKKTTASALCARSADDPRSDVGALSGSSRSRPQEKSR